jgi:glycyl-tRNA synthetase alpha chain
LAEEQQFSFYNFEQADVHSAWTMFTLYEQDCQKLIGNFVVLAKPTQDGKRPDLKWFPLLPAYDLCLKCSHLFNILDARGAISVTERVGVIARVRALAVGIAKAWVEQQRSGASPEVEEESAGRPIVKRETAPAAS